MAKKSLAGLADLGIVLPTPTPTVRKPRAPKLNPDGSVAEPKPRAASKSKDDIDYLSLPTSAIFVPTTSLNKVANLQPTITQPYRIAIIGEAPGRDEDFFGKPFMGQPGKVLDDLLARARTPATPYGILRNACFLGNISQHKPYKFKLELADPDDVDAGLKQLQEDLDRFNPNVCLLLGHSTIRYAKLEGTLNQWRGSFFIGDKAGPFYGRKCIASYAPASCIRNYEWMPLLMFDILKAAKQSLHPTWTSPKRELITTLTAQEIVDELAEITAEGKPISIDIEGGVDTMSCISVASSPDYAIIIPFTTKSGDNYWQSFDDEFIVWSALADILANPSITKILQNALYDRFVLQYSYSLVVIGNTEDTMLKSWELYCELEKNLGFLCSLFTDEPFYKSDRHSEDLKTFWEYCCRDSAVTYEICNRIETMLPAPSKQHYKFNIMLLHAMLYMELKGIRYDTPKAKEKLTYVNSWIYRLQAELDTLANCGIASLNIKSRQELIERVKDVCCKVADRNAPKKDYREVYPEVISILSKPTELTTEDLGFISIACDWSMNIRSARFKDYLYKDLGLPPQYNIEEVDGEKVKSLTTDGKALLKLQKIQPHKAVELAIQIGELRTRAQMLHIHADPDGRIRASYNIVGASTGRITCSTSPTGSGYNLQTIPDNYESYPDGHPLRSGMRDLFLADPGYHLFQCDLKGSDGWTIGANMAALGDPSMLDDLRTGIKPANRICYLLRHGNSSLYSKPRDEVKHLLKEIKKTDWDYFACKVGIWGICYLMGPDLLAEEIAEESQGKLWLSRKEVVDFQQAVFAGYPGVKLWHRSMENKLMQHPFMTVPSGHKRRFFSRKTDILGQALAHEPQANTTYATNMAAYRLWTDNENRIPGAQTWREHLLDSPTVARNPLPLGQSVPTSMAVDLRIQPLHQVHDALIGQFRIEDTPWAISKIKSYFDNTITIAGIPIIIPFEGNYGPSWGNTDLGTI